MDNEDNAAGWSYILEQESEQMMMESENIKHKHIANEETRAKLSQIAKVKPRCEHCGTWISNGHIINGLATSHSCYKHTKES